MKKLPLQISIPIAIGYSIYRYIYFDIVKSRNYDLYMII